MATFKSIGNMLVPMEEYLDGVQSGKVGEFLESGQNNPNAQIEFLGGTVTMQDLQTSYTEGDEARNFQPIGYGKPLTIAIKHIYTGAFPKRRRRDLLVTTSIKAFQDFEGKPKAINFIKDRFGASKQLIEIVPADQNGTFLVYYTQAVTDRSTTVTFEMITEKFDEDAFNGVADVVGTAAGIPVFGAANGFLLAGSQVLKLFAKIGDKLFDNGSPFFEDSEVITFGQPSSKDSLPGYHLSIDSRAQAEIERDYMISQDGKLVRKDDPTALYQGDYPYIIYYLDGSDRSADYGDFSRTMMTAGQLEKFYNLGDNQETMAGIMTEAMGLYNDLSFKKRAEEQKKKMEQIADPNSEAYKAAKERYEAYLANIQDDIFKPEES